MTHRSPVERIDTLIRRYYGRSFSYYWWRTSGLSTALLIAAGVFMVVVNVWYLWLAYFGLNVPAYFFNLRAGRRAWQAFQEAGPSLAAIEALMARMDGGES